MLDSSVLIHYHKTGHVLTRTIGSVLLGNLLLFSPNASRYSLGLYGKRCRSFGSQCPWTCGQLRWLDVLPQDRLVIVTAPELACVGVSIPSTHRVVHFVRDPARWAISAYDYHRQDPTPEAWVEAFPGNGTFEICRLPALPYHAILDRELANATLQMCHDLYRSTETLHQHLQRLREDEGVRLMALFGVLGAGAGWHWEGDMLRMAMNARALQPLAEQGRVHTVWLDEVVQNPEAVFERLARFLLPSVPSTVAVRAGQTLALQERAELRAKSGGLHVTSLRLNESRKVRLISMLTNEPILARVFALALSAVHKNEVAVQ